MMAFVFLIYALPDIQPSLNFEAVAQQHLEEYFVQLNSKWAKKRGLYWATIPGHYWIELHVDSSLSNIEVINKSNTSYTPSRIKNFKNKFFTGSRHFQPKVL
jgi:hypothetical protein